MAKLFILTFIWGPALVGFSLGWLLRHPHDWTGPAVLGPVGLLITVGTYRWGLRRRSTISTELRPLFVTSMICSVVFGVILCAMLALGVLG